MTTASLLWGVLFGSLGAGYCLYARKQRALIPGVCGVALMVIPYFLSNAYILVAVCLVVAVAPFLIKL
jgi:hypothetical protein